MNREFFNLLNTTPQKEKTMNVQTVKRLLRGGKIASVTFVKKNGETRVMNCRMGVTKGVTGEGMKYSPEKRNMLTVFDMQKNQFRIINASTITQVKCDGVTLSVERPASEDVWNTWND